LKPVADAGLTEGDEFIPRSIERGPVEAGCTWEVPGENAVIPRSIERGPVEAIGLPWSFAGLPAIPRSIERGPVEAKMYPDKEIVDGVSFRAQLSAAPLKRQHDAVVGREVCQHSALN